LIASNQTGYVVSDLHLFAHWSAAHRYMTAVQEAAAKADFFVLNGDIFDFEWTTLPTFDVAAQAAVDWLTALAEEHPDCQFHFVLGNHDCLRLFVEKLDALAQTTPNLTWHPFCLRLGSALFLHGDLSLSTMRYDAFKTPRPEMAQRVKRMRHALYRVLVATRAHRGGVVLGGRKHWARLLHHLIKRKERTLGAGITDVYFGHTHTPFVDYRYGGLTFHNTGSAVRGLWFNPIRLTILNAEHDDAHVTGKAEF